SAPDRVLDRPPPRSEAVDRVVVPRPRTLVARVRQQDPALQTSESVDCVVIVRPQTPVAGLREQEPGPQISAAVDRVVAPRPQTSVARVRRILPKETFLYEDGRKPSALATESRGWCLTR